MSRSGECETKFYLVMDRKTACKTEKLERNAVPWGFFSMYMGMSI